MWVVAHSSRRWYPETGPVVSGATQQSWTVPWFGGMVHSSGAMTVQPSEPNGGVLPDGRPPTLR